jgi:hypothetical protein
MSTIFVQDLEPIAVKLYYQPLITVTSKISVLFYLTSVDTEMCCPKGKCGCQYFILLTLKNKNFMDTGILDFF